MMAESGAEELRRGWPAIVACFATAVFGWGFGLYGQSVLLAGVRAARGWPTFTISTATTFYYLAGAGLIALVPRLLARTGPRPAILAGALMLGLGATVTANATAIWQLYPAAVMMAAGWACTSTTVIAGTLALWFDARRGLAISLALNGASASGFTVAPLLVAAAGAIGLGAAVPAVAAALLAVLAPLVLWGTARPRRPGGTPPAPRRAGRGGALAEWGFWQVATPFALALAAQVALLVHLVALLRPRLGEGDAGLGVALVSFIAMAGRLAAGTVIDRLRLRLVAAACFASQAGAVVLMAALPEAAWAQYLGCAGFGLSVGNVITLPALLIQREFAPARFGALAGLSTAVGQLAYSFAPALAGLVHNIAGGYGPVLGLCALLQLAAAVAVLPVSPTFRCRMN
jgi:MFS family permease